MDDLTQPTGQTDTTPGASAQPAAGQGTAPVDSSQPNSASTQPQAAAAQPTNQPPATPVEYGDFAVPDGYTMDGEFGATFKATARDLGLTQEQAQKLIDIDVKRSQAAQTAQASSVQAWADQSRTDPEIGGERFEENMGIAKKFIDAFADDEFKDLLEKSGLLYHPGMLRVMHRAGKAISEDGIVTGRKGATGPTTQAKKLFPDMA